MNCELEIGNEAKKKKGEIELSYSYNTNEQLITSDNSLLTLNSLTFLRLCQFQAREPFWANWSFTQ